MRFCPQCGIPLVAGAKFCVECGRALSGTATGAGDSARGLRFSNRSVPVTTAFIFVFIAITVACLGAAAWVMMRTPEAVRNVASAPPPSAGSSAPPLNPGVSAPNAAPPQQASNAEANPAAGGQAGDLPSNHPKIELPTEARSFIDKIEKEAIAKPKDIAAWNKFGAVSMRAAMFDASYYGKAEQAYGHVLKIDADNLDALRGIGDIDYDKQHYDEAVAAYEHYLKKRPDDPEVRTDLGTMYLYTGNADQAVVQYKKAIVTKPDFFQAYYNMGIAYAQQNKSAEANAALDKALALAPDDTARGQVTQLVAKLNGKSEPAPAATQVASLRQAESSSTAAAPSSSGNAPSAAASPAAAATGGDLHASIERNIRALPIAGPKVGSVEWPDKLKAKVKMDKFPMDQMPPFAKAKFLMDLKLGIDNAKKESQVSTPVQVDIVDGDSGQVMQSITE
jgi:tetratricopeptide (TPR) repeat protein